MQSRQEDTTLFVHGAKEQGRIGEREGVRGRERVGTRGLLLWINFVLINKKKERKSPAPHKKSLGPIFLYPSLFPALPFPRTLPWGKVGLPRKWTEKNPLEFTQKRKIVMWEGEKEEVYSTAEDSKGWKDTWRKIVKSLHFRPLE